jgi:hypothetical protein
VTRTRPSYLFFLIVLGAAVGWIIELALVATGRAALIPPITLGAVLGLMGILIVVLAVPVYRVVRRTKNAHVDPFYATRTVLLAKASSMTGSLLSGVAIAIVLFLLTRSVVPAVGSVTMSFAAVVGSVMLLVGGLIAEKMCTLPPEDDGTKVTGPGQALG